MTYDYFYGAESEMFSFFRIPRKLIFDPHFKPLSTDAKLLYGLLLDRMSLSAANQWLDDTGRVYIYFPVSEVEEKMNCGHEKAGKMLRELDGIGLIERVKRGQGKPTIIKVEYSKKFRAEHESDILLHQAAKKAFDTRGLKKLPTVKSLSAEYTALLAEKKKAYAEYRKARDEMRELQIHKANVEMLLGRDRSRTEQHAKEQSQR